MGPLRPPGAPTGLGGWTGHTPPPGPPGRQAQRTVLVTATAPAPRSLFQGSFPLRRAGGSHGAERLTAASRGPTGSFEGQQGTHRG